MRVAKAILYKTNMPIIRIPGIGVTFVHEDGTTRDCGPYPQFSAALAAALAEVDAAHVMTSSDIAANAAVGIA